MTTKLERGSFRWYSPYTIAVVKLTQAKPDHRTSFQGTRAYAEILHVTNRPVGHSENVVHVFEAEYGSVSDNFTDYRDASEFFEEHIGHNPEVVGSRIKTLIKELETRRHYGPLGAKLPWCFHSRSMSVHHGASTPWATKFLIRQHEYIGCDDEDSQGFVEVLEILDPPSGLPSVVIHRYFCSEGSTTLDFKSVELAMQQYKAIFGGTASTLRAQDFPGCIYIHRGESDSDPWYYEPPEEERAESAQQTG
jgi:hypothetical protein